MVAGAGFGSHIHVLGPAGWSLCGHRKIAPGDFVNLVYGSSTTPIFNAKKKTPHNGVRGVFFFALKIGSGGRI